MSIKNEEVLKCIKNEIYKLHPEKCPRVDGTNKQQLLIDFYFYRDSEDNIKCELVFLDGNQYHKKEVYNLVECEFDSNTLNELVKFLLENFPIVGDISYKSYSIEFLLSPDDLEKQGLSCNEIEISLNTNEQDLRYLLDKYLLSVCSLVKDKIDKSLKKKQSYDKYVEMLKVKKLNSLSSKDIDIIMNELSEDEKHKILFDMEPEKFFALYNSVSEEKDKVLIK